MSNPLLASSDRELLDRIDQLLREPAQRDNPLHAPLSQLKVYSEEQQERLERLIRISDGFHTMSRSESLTLTEQYDKQIRRLEKLARISDRYQNSLRELSEALKEAALRDPLTGLGNRRFLMERLKEETHRAQRKQAPYALGILDVDHFKSVNDRFGHEMGDKVLCEIGRAIQSALREYDLCGRWGGEEFLILLPETPAEFATQVAMRVCDAIRQLSVPLGDGELPKISASLGLTQYRSEESFSSTLNRADTALLRAKSNGRNQVQTA